MCIFPLEEYLASFIKERTNMQTAGVACCVFSVQKNNLASLKFAEEAGK